MAIAKVQGSNGNNSFDLQVYNDQVSGKTPKFIDKSGRFIYKSYSESEGSFFHFLSHCHVGHQSYQLSKYIPKYFGVFTEAEILIEQNDCSNLSYSPNLAIEQVHPNSQVFKQQLSSLVTTPERQIWINFINSRAPSQQNHKFIKLSNLTYGFKRSNMIDLKLGIKIDNKLSTQNKMKFNTTKSHGFRINGLVVRQFQKDQQVEVERFLSKYYCQNIGESHLNKHLAFFLFDGQQIHSQLLDRFINDLKQIIQGFLSFNTMKFKSSSLYLAYDAYDPRKYTINLIDFEKYEYSTEIDQSVQLGLKSCLRHLIQIRSCVQEFERDLLDKEKLLFQQNYQVIPLQKLDQCKNRICQN